MSSVNCDACSNIRENAPDFAQNGTTSTICESLHENTGFNPNLTVLHNNEEDLHDANDCLIGFEQQELESYDVCDWKEFEKEHLSRLYELLKAMICSNGGLWERLCDNATSLLEIGLGNVTHIPGTIVSSKISAQSGSDRPCNAAHSAHTCHGCICSAW